ncbi:basic leucine zipper 4-like [Quercus robur]|uniref:basic leucine zipper 4-like n=1 Tax=Quercus robur TaxID=38942 RepID=UPI0021632F5E|nr:basic leucine zipper 4-like [Quercus robur]
MSVFFSQEPVQFQCPVPEETRFTPDELQEILSLLESSGGDSVSLSPNSGSEGSSRAVYNDNERRLRRMISNRESARRSRWRKKKHVENLSSQMNRLELENQELKKRLGSALRQCHVVWGENERLRFESVALQARLSNLYRILFTMQAQ